MIELATTPFARMRGLLGRNALPPGQALLIRPCNAIHTLGMRFAIDARFYNKAGQRVREVLAIRPGRWWVWGSRRAWCVLESAAGDPTFAALTQLPPALLGKASVQAARAESREGER